VARFREDAVQGQSLKVELEVRRDDFELHRLLNDALVKRNIDLIDAAESGGRKKAAGPGRDGRLVERVEIWSG
jgi:hypothetical protein